MRRVVNVALTVSGRTLVLLEALVEVCASVIEVMVPNKRGACVHDG
jgi:hypothetical protein